MDEERGGRTATWIVGLIAAALLAAGAVVGFGLSVDAVGIDSTTTALGGQTVDSPDVNNPHRVNCGTALNQTFSSINCQDALSGRKTVSLTLMIIGGVTLLGTASFGAARGGQPGEADIKEHPTLIRVGWGAATILGAVMLWLWYLVLTGKS